jgi:hypothetical protein
MNTVLTNSLLMIHKNPEKFAGSIFWTRSLGQEGMIMLTKDNNGKFTMVNGKVTCGLTIEDKFSPIFPNNCIYYMDSYVEVMSLYTELADVAKFFVSKTVGAGKVVGGFHCSLPDVAATFMFVC